MSRNMDCYYKYQNISQVVHFSVCSKCPPPAFAQAWSLFGKLNMALLIESCAWQLVPYQLQNFLELIDVLWLGLKRLVAFKHSSPDMVVQRVEVWQDRRPFIFTNEFILQLVAIQSWSSYAMCAGAPSCWKMKLDGKTDLQSWTSSGNRVST